MLIHFIVGKRKTRSFASLPSHFQGHSPRAVSSPCGRESPRHGRPDPPGTAHSPGLANETRGEAKISEPPAVTSGLGARALVPGPGVWEACGSQSAAAGAGGNDPPPFAARRPPVREEALAGRQPAGAPNRPGAHLFPPPRPPLPAVTPGGVSWLRLASSWPAS